MTEITFQSVEDAYRRAVDNVGEKEAKQIVCDFVEDFDGDVTALPVDRLMLVEAALERSSEKARTMPQSAAKARIDYKTIYDRWNRRDFDFG